MSLKCGIVGLPNVGKSTLFNALTKSGIAAENYPFCTIEPNVGIVEVPDPRWRSSPPSSSRSGCRTPSSSSSISPDWWRARARARAWATSSSPTSARPTPSCMSCAASTTRTSCTSRARSSRSPTSRPSRPSWPWPTSPRWRRRWRAIASRPRPATRRPSCWWRCSTSARGQLNEAKPVRALDLSKEERANLKSFCLITAKPTLYAANVDEKGFADNPLLAAVEAHAAKEKAPVVAFLRGHGGGDRRPLRRGQVGVPGGHGTGGAGAQPPDPRRLPACWGCRPTSPPA
jgi:hypothetical protein